MKMMTRGEVEIKVKKMKMEMRVEDERKIIWFLRGSKWEKG